MTKLTASLAAVQKQHGTKLLWVKTTPVPTVPQYGRDGTYLRISLEFLT